jgi:hypothetical protein
LSVARHAALPRRPDRCWQRRANSAPAASRARAARPGFIMVPFRALMELRYSPARRLPGGRPMMMKVAL